MKQLTPLQISILLRLKANDATVIYSNCSDMLQLYNSGLIMEHLSGFGFILSQRGQKMVDKVLSLFNPNVMELSKSQRSMQPSEKA